MFRIRHDNLDSIERYIQFLGAYHGDGCPDVLAQFNLACEDGDGFIGVDANPGVQVGRLQKRAGQDVGRWSRAGFRLGLLLTPTGARRGADRSSGRAFDCPENPIIGPAAAQVAGHLGLDFDVGGVRVPMKQGCGGDDHTRRTEATLDGPFFDEGLLKGMQVGGGSEALQGRDLTALNGPGRGSTRRHGLPVDEDLARATLAQAAAELGSL